MIYVSFYRIAPKYLCYMVKCSKIQNKQLNDFDSLSEKARERLWSTSESIRLPKGSLVFKETQLLNKLFCIKKGACKFSKMDNSGQEHILRFLGEGEAMGKRSVVTNLGARVSAIALTETELCCLDKLEIQKNLEENPKFCQDFLDSLINDADINESTRMLFHSSKDIKSRLAKLLLYIQNKFGTNENGKLNVKLKRDDMATVLGTSPEYIINLLKKFRGLGLIDTKKRELYILSKSGLEVMAS
ncbi:Crp/Fnr family transcriptional regulator [Flagellimonas meridianipacifica]|uniref:CRP-like cAMP-binding protein n=1 Tax=Flagellimonas meridianipacifica TaxID=1080225 RepID=A0A2T0MJ49_9FLAO|nr:Crp/Fnr family transcriptional regulator [Allomuricauda pacifica]PRX57618.1 CRP-like cAMP-binding protein [Allomuricauda pacifica]